MAGTLTIDTLKAGSGVLATQNGMSGIAKAWVNYNGATQTISGSFNVSSVTYNSSGNYTINFTTSMPSAVYSAVSMCQYSGSGSYSIINVSNATAPTANALVVLVGNTSVQTNTANTNIAIFA